MNHYTSQDITMAKRFLSHLSHDEESIFAFQIFNDRKKSGSSVTPQVLCGTFDEFVDQFIRLQEQGAGIFVTINQTDGKGRKTENIVRVRAVFVDLDGSPLEPIFSAPLSTHIIIELSPGRVPCILDRRGCRPRIFFFDSKTVNCSLPSRYRGA